MLTNTNTIELFNRTKFNEIKIFINDILTELNTECYRLETVFTAELPAKVTVFFSPDYNIPLIRVNGFLLNMWLADITVTNGKLYFLLTSNFYENYKNKDLEGRIQHFSNEVKNLEDFNDKFIGVNNAYPDLVSDIKKLLL
jgi:hypothetical protein